MKLARILNELLARRATRLILLLIGCFLLATMIAPSPAPPRPGPAVAPIAAEPVRLQDGDPDRRRVGRLLFRRGWSLDSEEPRFGAISAMHVEHGRVTAISDAGDLFEFALPGSPGWGRVRVIPLEQTEGEPTDKRGRDTEALAVHAGSAWVAFERSNIVRRYRRTGWQAEAQARPRPMRGWSGNSGPEAMVRLSDGRFLIFSEGRDDERDYSEVVLIDGDPADPRSSAVTLRYRRVPGYRVTDADLLPDGRLLILNRRFSPLSWVSAKLVLADVQDLTAGATIAGEEIAELSLPLTVDNMEALSVAREGGRTIVRIASDDNFMLLQRTLLLEFELLPAQP